MGGREENKDLHMVLRVSLQGSPRRSAHHREVSGALQTTLQHTPRKLRSDVNKNLENVRTGKLIGSSLDAKVYLHTESSDTVLKLKELSSASNDADALHRLFITSQVDILPILNEEITSSVPYTGKFSNPRTGDIWIGVTRADGAKCERCWNYTQDVGSFHDHPTLCVRCYGVIELQTQPAAAAVS